MAAGISPLSQITDLIASTAKTTEKCSSTPPVSEETSLVNSGEKKRKKEEEPLSPSKQRAYAAFKKHTGLSSPNAKTPFSRIARDIDILKNSPGLAFHTPQGASLPEYMVSRGKLSLFDKQKDSGANASAVRVTSISFSNAPTSPEKRELLKQGKKPFSPQKKMTEGISTHRGCDAIGLSGRISGNIHHFAFFKPSEGDFTKISYADPHFEQTYKEPPVQFILSQLIPIADCLAALHKDGKVHRDLKGANLLYNIEGPGKVTDFDMVREIPQEGEVYFVGTTPEYAPGFIWSEVTDQRLPHDDPRVLEIYRRHQRKAPEPGKQFSVGCQTKEADVAGFAGHTMEKDVIVPMIIGLSKRYGIDNPLDLSPQKIMEPFDHQTMKKTAESHQGRVIYRMPNPLKGTSGHLLLYPPREEANKKIQGAITNLEGHHPQKELEALRSLLELSYRCKKEDPKELPSMEEVTSHLGGILRHRLESA